MIRKALVVVVLTFGAHLLRAQVQWIVSAGTSHFLGDLGGKVAPGSIDFLDLNIQSTRYTVGGGLRFHVTPWLSLKGGAYYGRLSADDKYTEYIPRKNRNLSFFTPLLGANILLEGHFGIGNEAKKRYSFFAGAEFFHFNPMTHYNGTKVALQPLGTEGQNFMPGKSPYSLNSWALPFGAGFKFAYFENGFLSIEVCARKTNTDYIDDASTTYPDKAALLASDGQMAVDLSDRSLGMIDGFSEPGAIRANSGYNDNFFFVTVSYNRNISFESGAKNRSSHRRLIPGSKKNSCYSF